jgi:hypothetical protein
MHHGMSCTASSTALPGVRNQIVLTQLTRNGLSRPVTNCTDAGMDRLGEEIDAIAL